MHLSESFSNSHLKSDVIEDVRTTELLMNGDALAPHAPVPVSARVERRTGTIDFRILADFAYDWISWVDPSGVYLYVSPSCERLTGYPPTAFQTDPALMERLLHPEDRAQVGQHFRGPVENPHVDELEFRIITRTGEERWIWHVCQPVYDAAGTWIGQHASNRDISERKQAEEALRDRERFIQGITNTFPDLLFVYDLSEEQNTYVNREITTMLGYTAEEVQAMGPGGITALLHPDDRERARELTHHMASAQDGEILEVEYRMKHAIGAWRWLALRQTVFTRTADGRIKQILGIGQDVTERKQQSEILEQQVFKRTSELKAAIQSLNQMNLDLQRSRDLLRTIFDAIQDGLLLVDRHERILAVNQAMANLLGRPIAELIHSHWEIICQEPTNGEHPVARFPGELVGQTLHDGQSRRQRERFVHPDGTIHMLQMQALPILASKRTTDNTLVVEQVVLHTVDVTEALKLEALVIENERLSACRKMTNIVAHEVNTPLQHILTLLERMPKLRKPERTMALSLAQDEIVRIGTMVRQLKDAYHLPIGACDSVNVNQVVERVLLLVSGHLEKHNIQTERDLAPDLPLIQGRADELIQVVLNVIINAIEAMPNGGMLQIRTRFMALQGLILEISDTGRGISARIQPHIFEPFFTTKEDGSGLGLFISQKIIAQYGGTISMYSDQQSGTTVTLTLPLNGGMLY